MSEPVCLFHVSDIHFGHEDRTALDWFASEVEQYRPHHIICTGDLTMRGNAREFAVARAWLEGLNTPVSLEIGNHDVPYYWYPAARIMHPFRLFRALDAAVGTSPDLANVGLTNLRTVAAFQWRLNLSKGRVAPSDLQAACASVSRQSDKALRIVASHHPLVDAHTASTGSTRNGHSALSALARAGADVFLSGHVHDAFNMTREVAGREIRMIGAGTLSQRLRASGPSYNQLTFVDGNLNVKECVLGMSPHVIPPE
ncbi:MAG: metallophosphoesterase [Novosphingobium sp.]